MDGTNPGWSREGEKLAVYEYSLVWAPRACAPTSLAAPHPPSVLDTGLPRVWAKGSCVGPPGWVRIRPISAAVSFMSCPSLQEAVPGLPVAAELLARGTQSRPLPPDRQPGWHVVTGPRSTATSLTGRAGGNAARAAPGAGPGEGGTLAPHLTPAAV